MTTLEMLAVSILIDTLNKLNVNRIKFTPSLPLGEARCHNDEWTLLLIGINRDEYGNWWKEVDGCYDENVKNLDLESINKVLVAIEEGKYEAY